jgi:hypothetical protein
MPLKTIIIDKKTTVMAQKPDNNQFTIEELNVIHDALVFTISCIDTQEIPQFNKMKIILAKVAGLIRPV